MALELRIASPEKLSGCRSSTGTYSRWLLTAAQGGTFVELELGMEPKRLDHRLFDRTLGRRFFRNWSEESLDGLGEAARHEREGRQT